MLWFLTVGAVNDAPNIGTITSRSTLADESSAFIPLQVIDVDSTWLQLTAIQHLNIPKFTTCGFSNSPQMVVSATIPGDAACGSCFNKIRLTVVANLYAQAETVGWVSVGLYDTYNLFYIEAPHPVGQPGTCNTVAVTNMVVLGVQTGDAVFLIYGGAVGGPTGPGVIDGFARIDRVEVLAKGEGPPYTLVGST